MESPAAAATSAAATAVSAASAGGGIVIVDRSPLHRCLVVGADAGDGGVLHRLPGLGSGGAAHSLRRKTPGGALRRLRPGLRRLSAAVLPILPRSDLREDEMAL